MKKYFAALTVVTVVLGMAHPVAANAATLESISTAKVAAVRAALLSDGIVLDAIGVDSEELNVSGHSQVDGTVFNDRLVFSESRGYLEVADPNISGMYRGFVYNPDVVSNSEISFRVKDLQSGDTQDYSTSQVAPSFAVALIYGIPLITSVLDALFAAALLVVVAGLEYVVASEVVDAITRQNTSQHYAAVLLGGDLWIGMALSYYDAISRARMALDVWSVTNNGAHAVAYSVWAQEAVGPEVDANGSPRYMHYHPANRRPATHEFFGSAVR